MLHGLETQKYASIDALLESVEGLATKPIIACDRTQAWILPPTYWGLTEAQIRATILRKIREWGLQEQLPSLAIEAVAGCEEANNKVVLTEVTKALINKTLHEIQPWFHGKLSRVEAEKRIEESGHKEGKFLIRERDDASYALCVSHEGTVKHYRIDVLPSGELAIQDGRKFNSLMAMVSHYTVFIDGLWTSLGEPCPRPKCLITNSGEILFQNQSSTTQSVNNATIRRNQYNHRSPALERNRNLINRRSSSRLNSNATLRLREWLNTINHKWSQLLSAMTPKTVTDPSVRLERVGHHFSTLPRHHLFSNNSRNAVNNHSSYYDYGD
ncbi:tyrosine-protein kinase SYK-like protein, partial [Dinothrombium tinctorium]